MGPWFSHRAQVRDPDPDPDPDPDADGDQAEQSDEIDIVLMFQQALRAVVRKCITEPDFAAVFRAKETVGARWPVDLGDG